MCVRGGHLVALAVVLATAPSLSAGQSYGATARKTIRISVSVMPRFDVEPDVGRKEQFRSNAPSLRYSIAFDGPASPPQLSPRSAHHLSFGTGRSETKPRLVLIVPD